MRPEPPESLDRPVEASLHSHPRDGIEHEKPYEPESEDEAKSEESGPKGLTLLMIVVALALSMFLVSLDMV